MVIYAASGPRRVRQLVSDLFMVFWLAVWVWVASGVFAVVDAIAGPARQTARTTTDLRERLGRAGDEVARVPAVGEQLASPLRDLSGGLEQIARQATNQAATIHNAAWVLAVLAVVVPVATATIVWLPRRVRFAREATAAQRFIDSSADLDLFALRAMAVVPMEQLARVSDDPVRAWREGDREVIARLATLELDRVGLRGPSGRRDQLTKR